jgi:histidine triad (HIT) family protein
MTDDCVFCKIVDGDIPADKIYEDETVYAFLDANPLTEGHTLVIPKAHREQLPDLSETEAAAYFREVPRIVAAVEAATGADGATLAWNDGEAAGQEVPHTHLHIIPRTNEDGHGPVHALFNEKTDVSDRERGQLADTIMDWL